MEFRDLKKQYEHNKKNIDHAIQAVISSAHFIQGEEVQLLEKELSEYVGVKHCITCGNGTDALQLALMTWNIGEGDAVFVPDFTFFSSGEAVAMVGAVPVFVDVRDDTYNIDTKSLEEQILIVKKTGRIRPKAIIAVDLFGQPAEYKKIRDIADRENLYVLEDGAQGFGGSINGNQACSFGDISTTSFFPAKPLGCYGDGGAIFTDNDDWMKTIRSLKVHGKGNNKYDNVRIGMNSRLDTIQAAIILAKLPIFLTEEIIKVQEIAGMYTESLKSLVKTPYVLHGYMSSWAQYTIQFDDEKIRNKVQVYLRDRGISSMVYYQKPMHKQKAFENTNRGNDGKIFLHADRLCKTVLSLPFHPYLNKKDVELVCEAIKKGIEVL